MEHRLIQGGIQFLPFARSRIKALQATGLAYASQSFDIEGCSVKVRITPGHEYISLDGGFPDILSGVVRGGEQASVIQPEGDSKTTLRAFKPTRQAWEYPLHKDKSKSPDAYGDEDRLDVAKHAATKRTEDYPLQYGDVMGSMYSGLMAKAVQIIQGYGKIKTGGTKDDRKTGVQLRYNWRFKCCHGIVEAPKDPDRPELPGAMWLVEISKVRGVIAMRLPMFKGTQRNSAIKHSKQAVLRETYKLFGGLPSGGTFPDDIAEGLEDKIVRQMLSPVDMAVFFEKAAYSPEMGWSFNDSGSEAHNTCTSKELVYYDPTHFHDKFYGHHYKIEFSFTKDESGAYVMAAALTEVSKDLMSYHPAFTFDGSIIHPGDEFAENLRNYEVDAGSATILACHIDGKLVLVKSLDGKESTVSSSATSKEKIPAVFVPSPVDGPLEGIYVDYMAQIGLLASYGVDEPPVVAVPAHWDYSESRVFEPISGVRVIGTEWEDAPHITSSVVRYMEGYDGGFRDVTHGQYREPEYASSGHWAYGCRDGFRLLVNAARTVERWSENSLGSVLQLEYLYFRVTVRSDGVIVLLGDGDVGEPAPYAVPEGIVWMKVGHRRPTTPQPFPSLPDDTDPDASVSMAIVWAGQESPCKVRDVPNGGTSGFLGVTPHPPCTLTFSAFGATPQMVYTESYPTALEVHEFTVGALAGGSGYATNYYTFIGYTE